MKYTVLLTLQTTFDDGTNSATYVYHLFSRVFVVPAGDIWKPRVFAVSKPRVALDVVAISRTDVVLAPPAAADQHCKISVTGGITFTTEHETMDKLLVTITLSEVDDHPYQYMAIMPICSEGKFSTLNLSLNTNLVGSQILTPSSEFYEEVAFIADTDYITVQYEWSALGEAARQWPDVLSICIGDSVLYTREYSGMYIEGGLKALITGAQLLNRKGGKADPHVEGLVAQIAEYVRTKQTPFTLLLPAVLHPVVVGAGVV